MGGRAVGWLQTKQGNVGEAIILLTSTLEAQVCCPLRGEGGHALSIDRAYPI